MVIIYVQFLLLYYYYEQMRCKSLQKITNSKYRKENMSHIEDQRMKDKTKQQNGLIQKMAKTNSLE